MSVVDFAFCAVFLVLAVPCWRWISKFLNERRGGVALRIEQAEILKGDSDSLLRNLYSNQEDCLRKSVDEILKAAELEVQLIIKRGKEELEVMVNDCLDSAIKKVSDQISVLLNGMSAKSIDVASSAVQDLIRNLDDASGQGHHHGEIISSLARDLNKKLN